MNTNVTEACTTTLPTGQVKPILDGAKTQHQSIQSWKESLNIVMVQQQ